MLYSLGIVLLIRANVGYAPWEVFHVGISVSTGISVGVASIIVGLIIVIIVTACGEKIGFGTIVSMIFTGLFIDIIFLLDIIPLAGSMVSGLIMLTGGLMIISLATYFYISSAFGAGPRDNLMVVLKKKTKMPVGLCRSIVELSVTVAGYFLGGMVGIGTVISVVAVGFFIQLVFFVFKFDPAAIKHETVNETSMAIKSAVRPKR